MIGLSADQGLNISEEVAAIAAREANWSSGELERQLAELRTYNDRLQTS